MFISNIQKATLIACLLFGNSFALADWVLVNIGENENKHFSDPTTVRKEGNIRKVWELLVFKVPNTWGGRSVRIHKEYQCKEEKSRMLSWTMFAGEESGAVVMQNSTPSPNFDYIAPRTIENDLYKYACSR